MGLGTILVLVACVLALIALIQSKGTGLINWACFLDFLGLTLSTWKGLL